MALKCVKCKAEAQFSIHGQCECGYDAPKRYNVGGLANEPTPTNGFPSRRAAARASRAAGNDGGARKS